MHDSFGVCCRQSVRDLAGDIDRTRDGEPAFFTDYRVERQSRHKLHRDIVGFFVGSDPVHRYDVCMVEPGGRSGFAYETFDHGLVGTHLFGQKFYGHGSLERDICCFEDDTHAAFAHRSLDQVVVYLFVHHGFQINHTTPLRIESLCRAGILSILYSE